MTSPNINTTTTAISASPGLAGRDCVPFFNSEKTQIVFEFFYLLVMLALACTAILLIQLFSGCVGLRHADKLSIFAVLGGFLGGWVYDAKWFYRVTARGKNNQYAFSWQPHKFYWRVLTPFLSSLVAFSTFVLATSDFFPIAIKNKDSARTAFAICFFLGYFSDLVLSRLAAWAERVIPKTNSGFYD